jgi:hypothetical protein
MVSGKHRFHNVYSECVFLSVLLMHQSNTSELIPPGKTPRLLTNCDNFWLLPRRGDEIHVKMPCCGAENP